MRVSIWFSGAAGSWVNTSWLLLGQLLAANWYTILADKEYASIIKWDNNDFFLYVSDQKGEYFLDNIIDYFFAFDDYAVSKNQKVYTLKNVFNIKDQACKHKNVFCFGASLAILNIVLDDWKALLAQQFSWAVLDENVADLTAGYTYSQALKIDWWDRSKKIGEAKNLMFGNECIATWAIVSGMDFYAAYPMTPASSLIDVVIQNPKVTFFQWEDEIAVSMATLWAKMAWKRAMCGTSGGGFALMTESLAFSNQAEIGWVYVLAQRDGPSTWTPTYTGQSDLNYALNASFGDTFPIVLCPSTFEEWYSLIGKALNWSDVYQHPVIFLTDKQYSEGYIALEKSSLVPEIVKRGKLVQWTEWFKRYEFVDDGISPYTIPGTENWEFIATSYEHDEYGATNEDPLVKKQMQDKRFKKMETFVGQEFTKDFYGYEIINPEAKKFFVTYGFNRYVLEDFIRQHKDYGLIVIKVFQPFDTRLAEFLEKNKKQIKHLIFVEMNTSGQMQHVVVEQCGLVWSERKDKILHHRKYTLYPIFLGEIEEFVRESL